LFQQSGFTTQKTPDVRLTIGITVYAPGIQIQKSQVHMLPCAKKTSTRIHFGARSLRDTYTVAATTITSSAAFNWYKSTKNGEIPNRQEIGTATTDRIPANGPSTIAATGDFVEDTESAINRNTAKAVAPVKKIM
jgi:hypothetical protein